MIWDRSRAPILVTRNFGCRTCITLLMAHKETHRQRCSSDNAVPLFDVFRVAKSGQEVRLKSTSSGARRNKARRILHLQATKPPQRINQSRARTLNSGSPEMFKIEHCYSDSRIVAQNSAIQTRKMSKKLLIVDDDPTIRLVIRTSVEADGYNVCGEAASITSPE
jgi:hypothetical protein